MIYGKMKIGLIKIFPSIKPGWILVCNLGTVSAFEIKTHTQAQNFEFKLKFDRYFLSLVRTKLKTLK